MSHFKRPSTRRFPRIQGHRGTPFLEPENSLEGFSRAADIGADSVELDVFTTADGIPVVFHGGAAPKELQDEMRRTHPDKDPNDLLVGELGNLTARKGNIESLTLETMKTVELKPEGYVCPSDRVNGVKIPTLEEALSLIRKRNLHVTVELKGLSTPKPVVHLLRKMGMVEEVTVSSFTWPLLVEAKALEPALQTAVLFVDPGEDCVAIAMKYKASEIHLRFDTVTKDVVNEAHAHGLNIMAWFRSPHTMKEEEKFFDHLIHAGVDTICTNVPDKLAQLKLTHGLLRHSSRL